jgi:hypothetical protein
MKYQKLDEPFVFEAAKNYFLKFDPEFRQYMERWMSSIIPPQAQGHGWEAMMPGVFITIFNNNE